MCGTDVLGFTDLRCGKVLMCVVAMYWCVHVMVKDWSMIWRFTDICVVVKY